MMFDLDSFHQLSTTDVFKEFVPVISKREKVKTAAEIEFPNRISFVTEKCYHFECFWKIVFHIM